MQALPSLVHARACEILGQITLAFAQGPHRDQFKRALDLWKKGALYRPEDDEQSDIFYCASQTQKNVTYTVGPRSCTCPAGSREQPQLCYHRIARRLALRYERIVEIIYQESQVAESATSSQTPKKEEPRKPPSIRQSQHQLAQHLQRQAKAQLNRERLRATLH